MIILETKRLQRSSYIVAISLLILLAVSGWAHASQNRVEGGPTREVNIPYLDVDAPGDPEVASAIFWFGAVDESQNYGDVRVRYDDNGFYITVHVFDRLLRYDTAAIHQDFTEWDAVSLYLDVSGTAGTVPTESSYHFIAQLSQWQPRPTYEVAYQGDGAGWTEIAPPFTTTTTWRGDGPNNANDDRGWLVTFTVPFSNVGLTAPPAEGNSWQLGLQIHDRDNVAGPNPTQNWPESLSVSAPDSWGRANFGLPTRTQQPAIAEGTVMIRQGVGDNVVTDAHVGGHSNCGSAHAPDYFSSWGDANYNGYQEINIQNQWDVADWPCFSKYYVTFPLGDVPAGKTIISATLTMHQFGTLNGGSAPSWLQIFAIEEAWQEETITWNNAPLASSNYGGSWAGPLNAFPGWPGVPIEWDVTIPLEEALAAGGPLRLAIYDSDGDYHSGRHFVSSDAGDWNAVARPTLRVTYGNPCTGDPANCLYLPMTFR